MKVILVRFRLNLFAVMQNSPETLLLPSPFRNVFMVLRHTLPGYSCVGLFNSLSLRNKQNAQNCKFEYRTHPLAEKWLNLTAPDNAYCIVRLLVTILPFTNNRRVVINNTKVYLSTFSKKKKKKKRVHQSLHESYIKVPATYCS